MTDNNIDGLITLRSKHSVDETVITIVSLLREKNIKLFAVIDHSGEAKAVGLKMPPTRLLIFGRHTPDARVPLGRDRPAAETARRRGCARRSLDQLQLG
jgi:uncharacterized protein (DUF302 family)